MSEVADRLFVLQLERAQRGEDSAEALLARALQVLAQIGLPREKNEIKVPTVRIKAV